MKFAGEARCLFGFAMKKNQESVRMKPFTYTDSLVVGIKASEAAHQVERRRVKPLQGQSGTISDGYE